MRLYPERLNRDYECSETNRGIQNAYTKVLLNEAVENFNGELNEDGWLEAVKKVTKEHQSLYINPKTNKTSEEKKSGFIILDAMTANMLSKVVDALKPEIQKKFTSTPIDKAAKIGWSLMK